MNTRSRTLRRVIGAIALIAGVGVAAGCGRHASDTQSAAAGNSNLAVPAAAVGAAPERVVKPPENVSRENGSTVTSIDSLPPEIEATTSDTLVVPGAVVGITATGSEDVTEVTLADGIGKPQPFAFDSTEKVWRTFYRIPMRPKSERPALSVTAKNGANRWRRVWVFLEITPDQVETDH